MKQANRQRDGLSCHGTDELTTGSERSDLNGEWQQ